VAQHPATDHNIKGSNTGSCYSAAGETAGRKEVIFKNIKN